MYRQGDVLIAPVAEETVPSYLLDASRVSGEPRDARGRLVLALGEVTGHAHAVAGPGRLIRATSDTAGAVYLHLPDGGRVVHEEHAAIPLPKGWFRVVRQREYLPGAVRIVAD
ncbi:hypothetical protein ACFYYH_02115 [Streptomyces sp. NPDC002018]|uniref:hypothetical protein n=1 Tax=Streptomyces sp. NPDC002018 TaxID=3364629 RepID=UPI0036802AD1